MPSAISCSNPHTRSRRGNETLTTSGVQRSKNQRAIDISEVCSSPSGNPEGIQKQSPWLRHSRNHGYRDYSFIKPEGLVVVMTSSKLGHNPLRGWKTSIKPPKVGDGRQPWALLLNSVGVGEQMQLATCYPFNYQPFTHPILL